jgi:hypothetical protein
MGGAYTSTCKADDNPKTTQTLEYIKDRYNVKIIKMKRSLLRSHQQPT